MSKETKPTVLLFDLGGVVLEFQGLDRMREMLPEDPGHQGVRRRWLRSKAIIAFETGKTSDNDFAAAFMAEWGLAMGVDDFKTMYRDWVPGPMPGAEALLEEVREQYTLACLSNTNAIHWQHMMENFGLKAMFEHHYASHLMGLVKPTQASFQHVCDGLNCAAGEILFFDDTQENVDAAQEFGMQADCVYGPAEVRAALVKRGSLAAG